MKFFVEYHTWSASGASRTEWDIIEFASKSQITKDSIIMQLVGLKGKCHILQIVKL